jgi:hypothetical protein
MKDVFEPALSMNKTNVFEPTLSFGGEKSEKSGKGKALAIELGTQLVGGLFGGGSKKAEITSQLAQAGSKKNADLLSCENISVDGIGGWLGIDRKKIDNRKRDCKQAVEKRYAEEEARLRKEYDENMKLQREKLALQKASLESNERIALQTQPKSPEPEKKSNKGLIIGLSVGGGVLVLATVLILVLRKKK